MDDNLSRIKTEIYNNCGFQLLGFKVEKESKEYDACRFELNGLKIVSRSAKVTPKKAGQFVTFWKRNLNGITEPLHEADKIDFYIVHVKTENQFGQFVFPKAALVKHGIISTEKKEGKRGFRVYPIWDKTENKQAEKTQEWQLDYFYEIKTTTDLNTVMELYREK